MWFHGNQNDVSLYVEHDSTKSLKSLWIPHSVFFPQRNELSCKPSENSYLRHRGYYTVGRSYEFYYQVVKTIFYERAQRVSKILFLPRGNKIHIFAPPCNILYDEVVEGKFSNLNFLPSGQKESWVFF